MKRGFLVFVAVCALVLPSMAAAATVLKGTVLEDAWGVPVTANVLAYEKNASGGWDFTGSEETDGSGSFSFSYLGAGTFYLEIDAFVECNPQDHYCADKYLPVLYKNAPLYDFKNKTTVTLKNGDVKQLAPIRVKTRPFYFESVSNACTQAKPNGTVTITRAVVNSTGRERRMMFWGVMDSPHRTDHSTYYNLSASFPFGGWKWKLLKPGYNTVTFTDKIVPKTLKGRYEYWVVGGDAGELPMTPYLDGWICYGVSDAECASGLSGENGAAKRGAGRGGVKTIPTKVSDDGEVLETGPLPR
jgi:hypothetical protein